MEQHDLLYLEAIARIIDSAWNECYAERRKKAGRGPLDVAVEETDDRELLAICL